MKNLMFFIAMISLGFTACKSTKDNVQPDEQVQSRSNKEGQKRGKVRQNPAEMIAKFDANKDGKLSKTEVKGPLADNFDTFDTNNDGFITLTEMKNAPKPERRQRGGRGQ